MRCFGVRRLRVDWMVPPDWGIRGSGICLLVDPVALFSCCNAHLAVDLLCVAQSAVWILKSNMMFAEIFVGEPWSTMPEDVKDDSTLSAFNINSPSTFLGWNIEVKRKKEVSSSLVPEQGLLIFSL